MRKRFVDMIAGKLYLSYIKSILRVVAFGGLAFGYIPASLTAGLLLIAELIRIAEERK
jgi:hypothetical protein